MPIERDVIRSRVSDIKASIQEPNRLTSKRYNELSTDEKYSMRYNIIVLVEALVALCNHIAIEELDKIPRSYRESVRTVAEYLNIPCIDEKVYSFIKILSACISWMRR